MQPAWQWNHRCKVEGEVHHLFKVTDPDVIAQTVYADPFSNVNCQVNTTFLRSPVCLILKRWNTILKHRNTTRYNREGRKHLGAVLYLFYTADIPRNPANYDRHHRRRQFCYLSCHSLRADPTQSKYASNVNLTDDVWRLISQKELISHIQLDPLPAHRFSQKILLFQPRPESV